MIKIRNIVAILINPPLKRLDPHLGLEPGATPPNPGAPLDFPGDPGAGRQIHGLERGARQTPARSSPKRLRPTSAPRIYYARRVTARLHSGLTPVSSSASPGWNLRVQPPRDLRRRNGDTSPKGGPARRVFSRRHAFPTSSSSFFAAWARRSSTTVNHGRDLAGSLFVPPTPVDLSGTAADENPWDIIAGIVVPSVVLVGNQHPSGSRKSGPAANILLRGSVDFATQLLTRSRLGFRVDLQLAQS